MSKLKGKVAVVTGGARDIGRAISVGLAKEGAKVVVNYFNSESAAEEVVEEIKSLAGEAIAVQADVSKLSDIYDLKEKNHKIQIDEAYKHLFNLNESPVDPIFNYIDNKLRNG